jgi:molybdate transport system substrate-binding protein
MCALLVLIGETARADDKILVFAAASLTPALDQAVAAWPSPDHDRITISYAASGPLARQIDAGAPAQIFISADQKWMDDIAGHGLIEAGSRVDWLGNELVLIAPAGHVPSLVVDRRLDLLSSLGPDGKLAIGDPQSVPAGAYAQAALTALGLWTAVEPHLARAESVRAALWLVSRGETPLGIVYRTDANAEPGVTIAGRFPADTHEPIVYPMALLTGAGEPAHALEKWLQSKAAAPFFTHQGFVFLTGD